MDLAQDEAHKRGPPPPVAAKFVDVQVSLVCPIAPRHAAAGGQVQPVLAVASGHALHSFQFGESRWHEWALRLPKHRAKWIQR